MKGTNHPTSNSFKNLVIDLTSILSLILGSRDEKKTEEVWEL